jgi:hypothetical protein
MLKAVIIAPKLPLNLLFGTSVAATFLVSTALPANAVLTFNIIEQTNGITIEGSGSIKLPGINLGNDNNILTARINNGSTTGTIISGDPANKGLAYKVLGPNTFGATTSAVATSTSGDRIFFRANLNRLGLPNGYVTEAALFTTAFYEDLTLDDLGFAPEVSGLVGTWDVVNDDDDAEVFDQVQLFVTPVPGPLPILGAGAAFGFSRRLRRRISNSKPDTLKL